MWPFMAMILAPRELDLQAGEVGVEEGLHASSALNASTVGSVGTQKRNAGLKEEERRAKDHVEKGRRSRIQKLWLPVRMQPPAQKGR